MPLPKALQLGAGLALEEEVQVVEFGLSGSSEPEVLDFEQAEPAEDSAVLDLALETLAGARKIAPQPQAEGFAQVADFALAAEGVQQPLPHWGWLCLEQSLASCSPLNSLELSQPPNQALAQGW